MKKISRTLLVSLSILCFQARSSLASSSSCDEKGLFYAPYLSTKTPYRYIENTDGSEIEYAGCKAEKIWAVLRHGTRTPGKTTDDSIRKRLPEIVNLIAASKNKLDGIIDVNGLKKWKPHAELDSKKRLTHTGEDEMLNLGERFGSRFPDILPEEWLNSSYSFRYTDTERTKSSAKYFTTGLFGRRISNHVWYPHPLKKDPILRFYKLCNKWRHEVKKNPTTYSEMEKFLLGEFSQQVVENVTNRLGLTSGDLNITDIQLIYTTCCFETAWDQHRKSPWCNLLTVDEFKVMEYAEDLEYYWVDGYGHQLTPKLACVMLQNVMEHLKSKDERLAVFYFTHSGTILKLLSHLGLYRDSTPLLHNSYEKSMNRVWRTSKIDVFASNVAFIRFGCSDGPKILTLHQERPVKLPGCPDDEDLCPLETIEETYAESLKHCNFSDLCSTDEQSVFHQIAKKIWRFFR